MRMPFCKFIGATAAPEAQTQGAIIDTIGAAALVCKKEPLP